LSELKDRRAKEQTQSLQFTDKKLDVFVPICACHRHLYNVVFYPFATTRSLLAFPSKTFDARKGKAPTKNENLFSVGEPLLCLKNGEHFARQNSNLYKNAL